MKTTFQDHHISGKDYGFHFDHSYLRLPACFYTQLDPEQTSAPTMVLLNENLAHRLGLDFSNLTMQQQAELLSGNTLLEEGGYFAQAYAGHQYGSFTMLGDGRALMFGEHITLEGQRFDLHFKGSGQTPYSRRGDGRATLGPMLREYIISEAMHRFGVPTTRSLAVVKTGDDVQRETSLPGAMLTRVATSHLRVGTFEFAASQNDQSILKDLLDYAIERHYPNLLAAENPALSFLEVVMQRQIDLIVQWMRVGFIHGVMNTDNMTISGETIDYGPCAFMDHYDPTTVFSSIDRHGRYAFNNQLIIVHWNLTKLAEALLPLIDSDADKAILQAQKLMDQIPDICQQKWLTMMRKKLGLITEANDDLTLIDGLLNWMHANHADFTNTFYDLSYQRLEDKACYQSAEFKAWHSQWCERLQRNPKPLDDAYQLMQAVNPVVIPRNHQVEHVLECTYQDNYEPLKQLLNALKKPYSNDSLISDYQLLPTPAQRVYQTFCGT